MEENVNDLYRRRVARGQARAEILSATTRLFAERGYLQTSISQVADAALVARPTIFTAVGNKPALLRAVVEAAIGGVDPAVSAIDSPWFQEVLEEPDPRRMISLHVRNIRRIGERISPLYYATEMAVGSDSDVAALWEELEAGRLDAAHVTAVELAQRPGVRPELDQRAITDILFTVTSPGVYRSLVQNRQWSPDRFESWADDLLAKALLAS